MSVFLSWMKRAQIAVPTNNYIKYLVNKENNPTPTKSDLPQSEIQEQITTEYIMIRDNLDHLIFPCPKRIIIS